VTLPAKGTPEYDLWSAAIDVALAPPLRNRHPDTVYSAQVPWTDIERLREALEAADIDWKAAKHEIIARDLASRRAGLEGH
jgi:hypothetical protein